MLGHKRSQKTKICCDKDFYVAISIKVDGSGTLSRHFTTLLQHKELKMAEKLCRDKRQLCRDTKFSVSIERQEEFITTDNFYVATNTE